MYMCMCMRRYLRGRCPCTVCGQNANKGEGMRAEAPRGRAGSAAVRNGHFPPLIMPLSLTLHIQIPEAESHTALRALPMALPPAERA